MSRLVDISPLLDELPLRSIRVSRLLSVLIITRLSLLEELSRVVDILSFEVPLLPSLVVDTLSFEISLLFSLEDDVLSFEVSPLLSRVIDVLLFELSLPSTVVDILSREVPFLPSLEVDTLSFEMSLLPSLVVDILSFEELSLFVRAVLLSIVLVPVSSRLDVCLSLR